MSALKTIAEKAEEKNLAFLVIGGHAVTAHGYPRKTFDLDIVVIRQDSGKWKDLIFSMGYVLHHEGPVFLQFVHSDLKMDPVDVMLSNEETFIKLQRDAIPAPAGDSGVKIVALRPLIALKCHSAKNGEGRRVAKDLEDVVGLLEANKLNPDAPDLRAIFLKYGTSNFYDQVQKICKR